jgi:acyl carrier protein
MSTSVTAETVEKRVVGAIESFGPEGKVTREASFEALDVDSLDLVELAQIAEEDYGVEIKSEDMKELSTVGDVIDLIVARAA